VANPPVVYLLHGEDEFAIARFLTDLEAKLGDPAIASLNVTRLEAEGITLEELRAVTSAMPILAHRRMVVLSRPGARFGQGGMREKFITLLDKLPPSTALVLVEEKTLPEKDWLRAWAAAAGGRCYVRLFPLLKGPDMAKWIQDQARFLGGQFTPRAAALLSSLVGEDARQAYQEIQKLLVYVNFKRAVEPEDVDNLTVPVSQGDIFAMVDALGNQDGRAAMGMLHRLLAEQDALPIFGMVVRQFRLLVLARDLLERGRKVADVTRELKLHPYVGGKVTAQARRFSLPVLETVYHRLLELDEAVKSGMMEGNIALDTFVARFTTQPGSSR